MADIIIPHVGETTTKVRILRWLFEPGEPVDKGEPLLEVETDKATLEIEAYEEGVLQEILVPEGEEADAMQVVGILQVEGEEAAAPAEAGLSASASARGEQVSTIQTARTDQSVGPSHAEPTRASRRPASPLARRLAAEHEIDLSALAGTGPDGMISADDVRAAIDEAVPDRKGGAELSRIQRAVATRMETSKRTIPHFYVACQIDMSEAKRLREELNRAREDATRISYTHLMIRAIALALQEHPRLNATFVDDQLHVAEAVHLGLAVALEEGLIVPVLKDAQEKGLDQIAAEAERLVERARAGKLAASEMGEGTITLSNLGGVDVEFFAAIVNPPQTTIVATGEVSNRPVAIDESQIEVRPTLYVVASGDHRVTDGLRLGAFLQKLKSLLEDPRAWADGP